jgi:lipopolysaccharide export system permease protein
MGLARALPAAWELTLREECDLRWTLYMYVTRRFLLAIFATFAVCTVLIAMIDMVELLRMSSSARDRSTLGLFEIALLRMPAFSEVLLSFAVLVGSMGALLSLNRRSELIVMRAGGMSVWQFLLPGLLMATVIGTVEVTLYNPLAARAFSEAERRMAEMLGRSVGLLSATNEGSWLRQDGPDGQSIISARVSANQGKQLAGVVAYQFDATGRFSERIDAQQAVLREGHWELTKALVSRPGSDPEAYDTYTLSSYLSSDQLSDALGSELAVSVWQLPSLIETSERAGLTASKYKMQYALLLGRPLLLLVMVIFAATVSLRPFRSGGVQALVVLGVLGGVGFFVLVEASRQIGTAGLVSPMAAVAMPIVVGMCVGLTVLLRQEDG